MTLPSSLNLFGGLVPGAFDETLRLADDVGQVLQRGIEVGPAVVDHACQRREPVLELHDLVVAVPKRGDEGLQVGDRVDDVPAAVGQDPPDTGQLSQRLTQLVSIAVQSVGGAVDESPDGARRHAFVRAQFRCQPHQLFFDLIPLDGDRRSVERDHRAVLHRRTGLVGGRELDVAGRDQVLGDDHRLGVGGNGDACGRRAASSWPGCRSVRSSRWCPL